jgi:casein kinase II subunit beta
MGLSDISTSTSSSSGSASPAKAVKLFCAKCEDIYNPKSSRHAAIDGAYFGSSFHNILFQVYPALIPEKSRRRYEPKIFGFRVHAASALGRWQDGERRAMRRRLKREIGECAGVEGVGISFGEDRAGGGTDSEGEEDGEMGGEDELGLTRQGEAQAQK